MLRSNAVTMLRFFWAFSGWASRWGMLSWQSTSPPLPMGYLTRPPTLSNGLTFACHSGERATVSQMLSMPVVGPILSKPASSMVSFETLRGFSVKSCRSVLISVVSETGFGSSS